ncbi:jg4861 [Pararge aegeria aegeria]|uniref:Jg4861 protein n=1 Tax=Pararge aegeria aegeria TaxID=348720 RepID=A0A8S4SBE3_9NEOP|nr:jg4861 [Pararge aegeria aegeria]
MASIKVVCLVFLFGGAIAQPSKAGFWKDTPLDSMVEEMRSGCVEGSDPTACIKYKVMSLLDSIFKKDTFQISDAVEVTKNGASTEATGRSSGDFMDSIENYIQSHDVTFAMPIADTKITVSPRNLDNDELSLNIKFNKEGARSVGEARKAKLKKIIVPILVFVLLKAMTLIPLAIGVLGLKAWNALQLSFFSFVVSVALAIFQLCKKFTQIAADNSHPQISAHGPWDAAYAATRHRREAEPQDLAQELAYNAYH